MAKKGDACFSIEISKDEFLMLKAFSECVKDKDDNIVSERELQEEFSKQFREEYPFLDQIHIKTIRDIIYDLEKVGILLKRGWTANVEVRDTFWELHASERDCTFEMIVGDE